MALQRHHDLADVPIGFHVLERLADVGEFVDLVDRQLQLARLDRVPDILVQLVEDRADSLDRAGTEGGANMLFRAVEQVPFSHAADAFSVLVRRELKTLCGTAAVPTMVPSPKLA